MQAVLNDMKPGQYFKYSRLVKEDLNVLSTDIKQLIMKAYLRADQEMKEKLSRDSFIDAVNDVVI